MITDLWLNEKVRYKRRGPGHGCFRFFTRVKMSAPDGVGSSKKRSRRDGFRYQMELNFVQKEDKDDFLARLDRVKGSLATMRRRHIDNMDLLSHLLDQAEREDSEVQSHDTSSSSAMLNTSGSYNDFN